MPTSAIQNGEEIRFAVPEVVDGAFKDFRVRRMAHDALFEKVEGRWRLVKESRGNDDPFPGFNPPKCMTPPVLYSTDAPGVALRNTGPLTTGGASTSPRATEVAWKLNLIESVQATGRLGGGGRAIVTERPVKWHNLFRLIRTDKASPWRDKNGRSEIELGHIPLTKPED